MMTRIKIALIISAIAFAGNITKAQVSCFAKSYLKDENFLRFKSTTTIFTLRYGDYENIDQYRVAIQKAWTITPFLIVKPNELIKYQNNSTYSFFYFDSYVEQPDSLYSLNIIYALKLGAEKTTRRNMPIVATINLYPDLYSLKYMQDIGYSYVSALDKRKLFANNLYKHSTFYNWSPGFLTTYLTLLDKALRSRNEFDIEFETADKSNLSKLKNEPLYIPEYVKDSFNQEFNQYSILNEVNEGNNEKYLYQIKFVSTKELDELILSKDSDIKYLVYTQNSFDKVITIYNSKNNKIIYQKYTPKSYGFRNSDLSSIQKNVN
ncbi:hypothetical protein [Pedobacter sp. Leaf250]|uniref:hypothetical protein n=1 Tax=Pedobacter sp. Leaf250 TaxID=2876559 RepID=UPI001E50FC33|nr:hypothetical protein [Pedobacter sp. Leaf250]